MQEGMRFVAMGLIPTVILPQEQRAGKRLSFRKRIGETSHFYWNLVSILGRSQLFVYSHKLCLFGGTVDGLIQERGGERGEKISCSDVALHSSTCTVLRTSIRNQHGCQIASFSRQEVMLVSQIEDPLESLVCSLPCFMGGHTGVIFFFQMKAPCTVYKVH